MRRSASSLVGTRDLPILYVFPPRPLHPLSNPVPQRLPKAGGPSRGTKHHGYGRARRTLVDEILILVENRKTLWLLGLRRSSRGPWLPAGVSRNFTRLYRSDGAVVLGGAW
jgi:hypothetical protein